jgi:Mg2+-importing ATPase
LQVLHQGVLEGRRSFGNVMKYILMWTSSAFGNMLSMAGAAVVLPFLPMLPIKVLLNNLLYELSQVTLPTDRVDAVWIRKPKHWDIGFIQRFMVTLGPVSSVFDFLTFAALLHLFHASEALFHTGWFIESLVTQTLVIYVIRTAGNPLRSLPSRPLAISTVSVVALGVLLTHGPLRGILGFVRLPWGVLAFVVTITAVYLGCVEVVKRRVYRQFLLRG